MTENRELRVLILDDMATDAELMVRELRRAGMTPHARRVETREAFIDALDTFGADVILLDFSLPHFDGRTAIGLARSMHPEIPIVVVTGTLADEPAIELLRSGAKDYVLKGNLVRLAPAVRRAIAEEQGIRNRKRAEKALREAHALLSRVTDTSPVGITLWDSNGLISFANPEAVQLLDVSGEELFKRPYNAPEWHITDFKGKPIPDRELPFRKAVDLGKPVRSFKMEIGPEHRRRKLLVNAAPVQGETGQKHAVVATLEDVTQLVAAEEAQRRHEEHLRLALAAAHMGTWVFELPSQKLTHSDEAAAIFGLAPGTRIADLASFLSLVHPEDRENVEYRLENAIMDSRSYGIDYRALLPDGSIRWVSSKGDVFCDESGAPKGILGVVWDINERKEAELALNRANKALQVVSAVHEQLIQAGDEKTLLESVCRMIVEKGEYRLAWVGKPELDQRKAVTAVAFYGLDDGFLAHAEISWSDTAHGHGPTGNAIRTGRVQVVDDHDLDIRLAPWLDAAKQRGYRSCIALPLQDSDGVFASLTIYAAETAAFRAPEIKLLKELADDLAYGISNLRTRAERDRIAVEQQRQQELLQQSLVHSIQTLASMLEVRDPYTAGHQRRVAMLAAAIAQEIGMEQERIEGLRLAASIHDIGKIQAPSEILNKPGKLKDIEFNLIKMHPQIGHDIIKDIEFPWPIARMVLEHHEKLDGSGYPNGLCGEQILLESRILTVADVVEAMTSHRPYRPGLGLDAALGEIRQRRGIWYEPAVVDACVKLFSDKRFSFESEMAAKGGLVDIQAA